MVTMLPPYEVLEIDGQQFIVLKAYDRNLGSGEDDIAVGALLYLSRAEFMKVQALLGHETVEIKRSGIDSTPLRVRWNGTPWWSEHNEGSETHYKQRVGFLPSDTPRELGEDPPRQGEHEALANQFYALTARFEALVNYLIQNSIINSEQGQQFLGDDWQNLLDHNRIEEIRWQTHRWVDAETGLDEFIAWINTLNEG